MQNSFFKFGALLVLSVSMLGLSKPGTYSVVTVENGASIKGSATLKGDVPAEQKIAISKDNDICGTGSRGVQWVVTSKGGNGLQNVAVYFEKMTQGKAWAKPEGGYKMNQEGCRFMPAFSAVPKGENLTILNSDPTLHNIHTYEMIGRGRRTMFNVGQPEKGFEFTKPMRTRRGNTVKVECDAHNFMHAWIFVPDNPYYALVDENGGFQIGDIPAGSYKVKAWHPTLGVKESEITLKAGQAATLNFDF